MKILLTGGGSGGHITPLLAVAHELKQLEPTIELIGICESNAKFKHLFEEDPNIDAVYQVQAGKYRRYAGLSKVQRLLDIPTFARNVRDVGRVVHGYGQARRILKRLKPDGILIKGGFVGVPIGLAAVHLNIPFITHDSDTTAGLANRIISRWAYKHATGMPIEFYSYPKKDTVFTGVPIRAEFVNVTSELRQKYRKQLGLENCKQVIGVIGASQGGTQLNDDIVHIVGRLMQLYPDLGLVHLTGPTHEQDVQRLYDKELLADERRRTVVKGFATDVFRYTGAANIVVSRASASVIAELAVQGIATILVPGQLAGDHQGINARHLAKAGVVLNVPYGDSEGLFSAIHQLLENSKRSESLAEGLHSLAKPYAAKDLAQLVITSFRKGQAGGA
jgi:UDP-N-acetylglucosamine--N-acetylmuramyl-(pentapeptide) pyrophosphoryl-undecaprenol N-acetylglucosamine transferase